MRPNGTKVRLDELIAGDRIRVVPAAGDSVTSDLVSRFSLADRYAVGRLIVVRTASATLRLTPTHRVPVGPSCCTDVLKQARELEVGMRVWVVPPPSKSAAVQQPRSEIVEHLSEAMGRGLHNPMMMHGSYPIVDGVVTAFERPRTMRLAGLVVPLVEAACEATATCEALGKLLEFVDGLEGPRRHVKGSSEDAEVPSSHNGLMLLSFGVSIAATAVVSRGWWAQASR